MPLSMKQWEAIQPTTHRINIWDGAIRSGKTIASIIAWLHFCQHGPAGPLAMIGKTHITLARNVLDVIDELHPGAIKYTRGASTAIVMGRLVHIFGANNAAAESKIRGLTLAGAYIDEATLVSEQFFAQTLGRMSIPGARLFATTNPDSNRHWLMQKYLKRADELDLKRWKFQLGDNPALTREYVRQVSMEFTGLFYKRFILGEWVAADGAVYEEFDEDRMTITADQVPHIERVLMAGLDYGQTHKTRAYLLGIGRVWVDRATRQPVWGADADRMGLYSRRALFVLDEYAPGNMTVGQHADGFMAWLAGQPHELWRDPEWIAVDPAAAVFKRELTHRGVTAIGAHNAVLPGIQTVSSLLVSGGLYIVRDRCPELLDTLPLYLWDSKAADRGETKPIKQNDDEVDALRYTVYSSRREWQDVVPLSGVIHDEENDELEQAA